MPRKSTDTAANAETEKKDTTLVSITVPISFKEMLDAKAKEADVAVAQFVRQTLADAFGVTLPPMQRRTTGSGLTKEQRAEQQRERQNKGAALLRALEAGELGKGELDLASILAKYAPKPRAKKDADTESADSEPASVGASA